MEISQSRLAQPEREKLRELQSPVDGSKSYEKLCHKCVEKCFTDHYNAVSTATESIQFDGRAVSLGSGTSSLHVPTSTSPAQAPSTATPIDINLNVLRSPSPASQSSSPAPSQIQIGTISPSTTDKRSTSDGQDVKSITQLLQQSAQQLFKTQLDMPPPTSPTTAPSPRKRRRKRDDPQSCLTNSEEYDSDEASPTSYAEVERFQGKVVYNLDGKAYIIDSENELSLQLSDSSIKDVSQSNNPKIHSFRVISSRDATMNSSSSTQSSVAASISLTAPSTDPSPCTTPSLEHTAAEEKASEKKDNNQHLQRQQKPILMCFICKLSFGNTKLFSSHANTEHKINLSEPEKTLLCREYSSAIIQKNSDENSQISFLEPLDAAAKTAAMMNSSSFDISKSNLNDSVSENNDNNNNNHDDGTENDDGMDLSADKTDINKDAQDEHQPRLTPKSLSSLTGRTSPPQPPALNVLQRLTGGDFKFLNSSADLSQLTSLLEQHKTLNEFLAQQQHQQLQHQRLTCPEHADAPNLNDIDCKNCEFLNINLLNSPLTLKSPIKGSFGQHQTESNASSTSSKTSSPITSSVTPNSALQLHQNLQHQQQQSNLNTSPSFTIGACPDHMNGRPIGVDCARCEILLNSARLNSGVQISTRNSCKTLKCPQCNWHYKYQETLEIHMREKHPDGESACGYCLAGAAHPRLARGESYTCGYKPYRCEICNYSTTTKGNLSIHMQSDKHLNNVQELSSTQNLSVAPPPEIRAVQPPSQPAPVSAPSTPLPQQCKPKPKPSFRCEPCSYETPNARNYRIHETSEKHTHNLAVVQCNIKRLQSHMDSFLQQTHSGVKGMGQSMVPSLEQAQSALSTNSGHLPGAALADLAYNQALLIQLLHQNSVGLTSANGPGFMSLLQQQQQQQAQSNQQSQLHYQQINGTTNQDIDQGLNPETLEPPFEQDFNPIYHFACLICSNFNTNDLEELNNHINEDRSRLSFQQEFIVVASNNNYTCRLCCYKTHLKANCQLHCKTDKHLQRVNFANHIKQGGLRNEYKFEYVINSTTTNNNYNITQLKCNCCDYYTNSIQKLNCHIQNVRHESMKSKFNHVVQLFKEVKFESIDGQDVNSKALQCQLCNYKTNSILDMVKHNKSLRHIQIEQIYCLQRRCESLESMDIGDVYQLVDDLDSSCSDFAKDDEKPSLSPSSRSTPQAKSTPKIAENEFSSLRSSTPMNVLKMVPFEQLQQLAATLPSSQTILKCNQCDHLTENKIEMEQHFDHNHPNNPECNSIVLPSMAALMAAAQMNYEPKMDQIKHDDKSDDLTDKMLEDSDKSKQNCDTDVMTIEPDIDGVIINNSSRSSSAVSMLEGDEKISTGAMRTTPQNQHLQKSSPFSTSSVVTDDYSIMCPLCQESFTERKALEQHVMCIHSVNADGLNRLLQLVDTSHWLNNKKSPERSVSTGGASTGSEFECLVCSDTLKNLNDLLMHATDHQHFSITGLNQFGCLLKSCHQRFATETQVQQHFRSAHLNIVISERHVYKYRCPMCPLAFKTEEKLNTHFMYHTMRDATKCNICNRNFRSTTSLQRHVEQVHATPTQDLNKSTELTDDERMPTPQDDAMSNDEDHEISEYDGQNSEQVNEESSAKRFKAMKRSDKITNYSLEKYHDPNRPYKCDDCFESFTQANILTVHKNSVSHLHRVKQKQKETHSGSSTPALGTSPNQGGDFDRRSVDFDRKSVDYEMEISNTVGDTNKRKLSCDNDYDSPKKRFKCDICKVAYAQGSTLDIHMRSVGHQAKANRIMQQQLQQGSSTSTTMNPQDLLQQQQLPSNNGDVSPKLANNQMYKTLLENFGFDIVKQFNDINKTGQGDLMNLSATAGKAPPVLPTTPKKNGNADEKKDEKFFCRHCKQVFNNVFMLKAHCEEVHGEKLPLEALEKEQDNEILDFSQAKASLETSSEAAQMAEQMKLFNPEMLQQKMTEQKFDPAMLAQRLMEQQFLSQFPQISQSLQNLSSGSMPMNTLEMLNLMQFHHFMSMNFMNLAPPLIFGGAQQGGNLLSPGQAASNPTLPAPKSVSGSISPATPSSAPSLSLLQQQQQQQAGSSQIQSQACGSQKRARTRITDDQLKILRSHFDINNSPSEESIVEMSKKANLPQKVVKHWFRNTLFKERQRNKDSPYNFANPPSTTLNLEEYERTGQTKTTPLADSKTQSTVASQSTLLMNNLQQQQKLEQQKLQEQQQQFFQQQAQQAFNLSQQSQQNFPDLRPISQPSSTTSNERDESFIKSEPMDEMMSEMDGKNEGIEYEMERYRQQQQAQNFFLNSYETKSESGSSDILSRPQTPNSLYSNINDAINQQIESIPINNISGASNMNQMGPPKKFQLNKIFDKSYESNSSSSNSSTSSGKRANRTRFTDYQIKVLQEFFENNSYPKDSDLEYLSKLLLLSPRVIVVWFQNARQKQRKIYENQPNSTNTPYDAADEKKSACINYTCKKCNLIFQRYYELIRHQKNHCFKEENNKKSAKAQIAAAQIAQSLSSEDSNSSLEINHANNILGNNLLHPVTSTTKSQQTLAQSLDAATPPLAATKMNLNHPVNLITTSSGTQPNIMQPLDFHQQSAPNLLCHSQQPFEVDPHQESHLNYNPAIESQQQSLMGNFGVQGLAQPPLQNPYNTEQMQEFLLQKFSTQDFDLLTKNYDFFLQYYKANCPVEQQMDEKHLTMDFLSQFYHLNEFKKKLNGNEMEPDDNASGDEMHNDNDDVVALEDKEELDFNQLSTPADAAKGKMGISNYNSNKRLRTTILPEQLNYLYECYQKESNPSRKQLEEISKKVNLKKRVVQVWYQNSRARERKGQFRQNMQIINKKCPYCSAIFKVKSALESHLQTKHIDKQMVNIDAIPEINFTPKESHFAMQMPNVVDMSSVNVAQPMSVDFWKSKMMQQPQTSQFFGGQKRMSEFSESEISFTDSNNDELVDEDYDMDNFNDDSNHVDDFQNATAQPGESNKSKRHRTHVNRVQKSILRKIFDDVKSPSMIDCENIGREIGLFKRVVQVWFQNARANYKKCHKISTNELKHLPERNPSECQYCADYNPLMAKTFQSHALSQHHIQNVHNYVMKNESHPDEEDDDDCQEVDLKMMHKDEQQPKFHSSFDREPSGENRKDNFQTYTNCHPQKSLLVGDMHWIE